MQYQETSAVLVWQTIPGFLSTTIESVQKRALKVIFPAIETYSEALELAKSAALANRRDRVLLF